MIYVVPRLYLSFFYHSNTFINFLDSVVYMLFKIKLFIKGGQPNFKLFQNYLISTSFESP